MEESTKLFRDKSWFQNDADCKIFPQDLRNGKNWSAVTRGANRVERRQLHLMRTSRQPHLKPLFRVSWNNILPLITYEQVRSEIQAYIEARRSQFAFKTVATKSTSGPTVRQLWQRRQEREVMGNSGKKEGQYQRQHPNPNSASELLEESFEKLQDQLQRVSAGHQAAHEALQTIHQEMSLLRSQLDTRARIQLVEPKSLMPDRFGK